MLSVRQNAVELLGGPFDGQRRSLLQSEEPERFLALPLNAEARYEIVHDEANGVASTEPPGACVAIYELETADEFNHYRFACVTAAKQSFLEGWLL